MQSPLLHQTPGTGRRRSVARTPLSALTPNDDAAEKASVRRQRHAQALRKSLSEAFTADDDLQQQAHQQQQQQQPCLSAEALSAMFEHCIRLAAENKITDRNVWQLDLISHLPDIVLAGQAAATRNGFNFQKVSGGLDAGVTIYSKRVDQTYKEAFQTLQGAGAAAHKGGAAAGEGDGGGEGGDGEPDDDDDDTLEDAAAAAASQAKQQAGGGKRRQQVGGREEATLARPEQLAAKPGDAAWAVDPLFHKMSALFDEGGAKGLLLLNRSVFAGAAIMTNHSDVPEDQFPLPAAAAQPDTLVSLAPLHQELAACQQQGGGGGGAGSAVLTPGLEQLYALLEQSVPRQRQGKQQQGQAAVVDVAAVMSAATSGLPDTPMPGTSLSLQQPAAPAAGAGQPAVAANPAAAARQAAGQGPGRDSMVAAFLASQPAADEEEEAAAAAAAGGGRGAFDALFDAPGDGEEDGGFGDGGGGEEGHPGYGDDDGEDGGGSAFVAQQQQQQQQGRRRSGVQELLGLGGEAGEGDGRETLDAEALQQLLGGAGGGGAGVVTKGAGWAGSSFWRYRAAAAAVARLAGGGSGGVKRAASSAAAIGARARPGQCRIDFEHLPQLPPDALAVGSRRQTCLATAPSTANTLLPRDLHYEAASLGRLFLKPAPISIIRHPGSCRAAAAADEYNNNNNGTAAWAAADSESDGEGGWGGFEDDDGEAGEGGIDDSCEQGYNAGDLSMGDPGSCGAAGSGMRQSGDWWSPDHELLRAPARAAGLGVSYHRSAKQVDVKALKDLIWDGLVSATPALSADSAAAGCQQQQHEQQPVIPFQQVIVGVPERSAAGSREDVSVHMCFICLLHLANEKGLVIRAQDDLATLNISNVPQSS